MSAAALSSGTSDQDRIVSAVKRVSPSVVALNVTVNGRQVVPVDPFQQFFGGGAGRAGAAASRRAPPARASSISATDGADRHQRPRRHPPSRRSRKIEVVFPNGDRVPGHVYSRQHRRRPGAGQGRQLRQGAAADRDRELRQAQPGQWAIAIGEPFELKQSVTVGVVSGFNRDETIGGENGGAIGIQGPAPDLGADQPR